MVNPFALFLSRPKMSWFKKSKKSPQSPRKPAFSGISTRIAASFGFGAMLDPGGFPEGAHCSFKV